MIFFGIDNDCSYVKKHTLMKDADLASKCHYGAFGINKYCESNAQLSLENLTIILAYKYVVMVPYYDG
jgi:hypothetical protein